MGLPKQGTKIGKVAKGLIFNIQHFSVDDGPGIRTIVFFKGCPARCLWCSNPESRRSSPELSFIKSLCNLCGRCIEVCHTGAISIENGKMRLDRSLCRVCGECAKVCYRGAFKVLGEDVSLQRILEEVKRDWLYYLNTDGGLTLSGGEPLQQMDFAISLLKGAAELGLSTCVETCGYVPPRDLLKAARYTDLFLYDLKCMDDALHSQYVGVSNQLVLENARLLTEKGIRTIFGIPLISGITDTGDNIRATAEFVSSLRPSTRRIRLLPYHRFGISKFKQLGYSYKLHDVPLCGKETIEKARDIIVNDFKLECEVIGSWS